MFKASICTKATFDCINDDRFDTVLDLAQTMNASILLHTAEGSIDRLKEMLVEELDEEFDDGEDAENSEWDHADIEWYIERGTENWQSVVTIIARVPMIRLSA